MVAQPGPRLHLSRDLPPDSRLGACLSLPSFAWTAGKGGTGAGTGEGKGVEMCARSWPSTRGHVHPTGFYPLKTLYLLYVWLQDQETSPYLPLFLFEGTVARC